MHVIFGQSSAAEEHHWNLVQNNGMLYPLSLSLFFLLFWVPAKLANGFDQAKEQPR